MYFQSGRISKEVKFWLAKNQRWTSCLKNLKMLVEFRNWTRLKTKLLRFSEEVSQCKVKKTEGKAKAKQKTQILQGIKKSAVGAKSLAIMKKNAGKNTQ